MSAILNSIAFEKSTEDTLLKIMEANSPQEHQMTLDLLDVMADLGESAVEVAGVPDGEYMLVIQADLTQSKDMTLFLCSDNLEDTITLGNISLEVIAQSALFYREDFNKAQDKFEDSAQDDTAEEEYENDLRKISALRSSAFASALAPYVTDSPEFFHELLQAFDLLSVDYAENLLAVMPQEQLTAADVVGAPPPRRTLN